MFINSFSKELAKKHIFVEKKYHKMDFNFMGNQMMKITTQISYSSHP